MGGPALFAMAAVSAISSIQQGNAAKAEADRNALLLEGKAQMIEVQKGIDNARAKRAIGKAAGSSMVAMAGMGVMPTGSPMAYMIDQQKEMEIDRAIGNFNAEASKRYTIAEAESRRRMGKYAQQEAYANAFTSILKGGYNLGTTTGFKLG